jgi:dissimilatory sulfite reductase (desulfoviridin) alpha/beta subunit
MLYDVSKRFGNGEIHLTTRQCVEIPFIKLDDAAFVADELERSGIRLGLSGPVVRTVTGCPGNRVCPRGLIDSRGLAEEIDKQYYGRKAPHKFKIAVSGCPSTCVKPQVNDLGVWGISDVQCNSSACTGCGACVKACRSSAVTIINGSASIDKSLCAGCAVCSRLCPKKAMEVMSTGYAITVGGKMGRTPVVGHRLPVTAGNPDEVLAILASVLEYYNKNGKPGERLAGLLHRTGIDGLINYMRLSTEVN